MENEITDYDSNAACCTVHPAVCRLSNTDGGFLTCTELWIYNAMKFHSFAWVADSPLAEP